MASHSITVDLAVWSRDTYEIEIPDDIAEEDREAFIDDAIDNGRATLIGETEYRDAVYSIPREVAIDGEPI